MSSVKAAGHSPKVFFVANGLHGNNGHPGASGHPGRGSGASGSSGDHGERGHDGTSAQNISLQLLADEEKIHIVRGEDGQTVVRELEDGDANELELAAVGGNGGRGGDGGRGGSGAQGSRGRNATRYSSGGNGGPGGNGGNGGVGGDGGHAGAGGIITLQVTENDTDLLMLLKQKLPPIQGGQGGSPGAGGRGGSGGSGGPGGSSYSWTETTGAGDNRRTIHRSNPGGHSGRSGHSGADAPPGRRGQNGHDGQFRILVTTSAGQVVEYHQPYTLEVGAVRLSEPLGYGLFEPGCTVDVSADVCNVGGMPLPSQQNTFFYAQSDRWIECDPAARVLLPAGLGPGTAIVAPTVRCTTRLHKEVSVGKPFRAAWQVDHRAQVTRVQQEFVGVREQTTPFILEFPCELSAVQVAPAVSVGEEAPFAFCVENKSNQPIGSGATGSFTRALSVSVLLNFAEGSHNHAAGLKPSDVLLRDHHGDVVDVSRGLFRNVGVLLPKEKLFVCGTIAFLNSAIPPLTTVELQANLCMGTLDDLSTPFPVQIMPFRVQKASYYVVNPDADYLLVVNHKTTTEQLSAWQELVSSLGGHLNTWNISLQEDFTLTHQVSAGRTLLRDFACQTVIILNAELTNVHGTTMRVFDLVREDELLEAARDYGISVYVVGEPADFSRQLVPTLRTKREVLYFPGVSKYVEAMRAGEVAIQGGAHPYPATRSSDLCGVFKQKGQQRWLSLFKDDRVLCCFTSAFEAQPQTVLFIEDMQVQLRPSTEKRPAQLRIRVPGSALSVDFVNPDGKTAAEHADRQCFSVDPARWLSVLSAIEGVTVSDTDGLAMEPSSSFFSEDLLDQFTLLDLSSSDLPAAAHTASPASAAAGGTRDGAALSGDKQLAPPSTVELAGWLDKHSRAFWWNKRYFVLHAAQRHIEYYKKDDRKHLTGVIFLHHYAFKEDFDSLMNDEKSTEFTIVTGTEEVRLRAPSVQEKRHWISTLRKEMPATTLSAVVLKPSAQVELNAGLKQAYRESLTRGQSVAEASSRVLEPLLATRDYVARIPVVRSYLISEPDTDELRRITTELATKLNVTCPNQRLFLVYENDRSDLSRFKVRLGYVNIYRSLDVSSTHMVSVAAAPSAQFITSPCNRFMLIKAVDFSQKLSILQQQLADVTTDSLPKVNTVDSFLAPTLNAILSDVAGDASCFAAVGRLDVSSVHSQLNSLRVLSRFPFDNPDSPVIQRLVVEILFYTHRVLKRVEVDGAFVLKRPFARRALLKSIERVAHQAVHLSSTEFALARLQYKKDWIAHVASTKSAHSRGDALLSLYKPSQYCRLDVVSSAGQRHSENLMGLSSTERGLSSRARSEASIAELPQHASSSAATQVHCVFDTEIRQNNVLASGAFSSLWKDREESHVKEKQFAIRDDDHRCALLLNAQQSIHRAATIDDRLPLEPCPDDMRELCVNALVASQLS
mmetsp:Transcript_18854/g.47946  ORF Transcript_18854/g.47946 Transcript_18854/m.47946 type:complete len:1449 (-) Transcript_18854:30-4376(-)